MQSKCEMSITSGMIEGPMILASSASHEGPTSGTKREPEANVAGAIKHTGHKFQTQLKLASHSRRGHEFSREPGNKCGKCQNHDIEVSKKGHAKDCPFKRCDCLRCRLLDARSDILQVISGKETKLKGTKKDPNCGFCQNHSIKILRKGHVRSCGFGQERHFKLDNCFDCEVHYIRNEVNRLQIKMRRAMKEDRTLSEEQRKTAREAITRDEVEKVCDLARLARKKREAILAQQAGECSAAQALMQHQQAGSQLPESLVPSPASSVPDSPVVLSRPSGGLKAGGAQQAPAAATPTAVGGGAGSCFSGAANQEGVWRPWSQHQVAAAIAVAQQQHHHHHHQLHPQPGLVAQHQLLHHQLPVHLNSNRGQQHLLPTAPHHLQVRPPQPQPTQAQLQPQPQQQRFFHHRNHQSTTHTNLAQETIGHHHNQHMGPALTSRRLVQQRPMPYAPQRQLSPPVTPTTEDMHQPQPLPLTQRNLQDQQQILNTIQLFRLIAQVVQSSAANSATEA